MSLASTRRSFRRATHRAVVVTEVTRMQQGLVCVAALDLTTGNMVRPLRLDGSNWEEEQWVPAYFAVGNVLDVEPVDQPADHPFPHASDDCRVAGVDRLGAVRAAELFALCEETPDASVDAIFGPLHDDKYVVAGTHVRSLGCVMVEAESIHLGVSFDKVRLSWRDAAGDLHNLPVTELATRNAGDAADGLIHIRARLAAVRGRVALRLGLARAWTNEGEYDPPRCYPQLNGIVFSG